ncbi:MAG: hypothetical protein U0414_11515 [Polyangiaceae bacterium]
MTDERSADTGAADHAATAIHSPTRPTSGRLALLTGFSLAASAIPLPFLPDRVIAQVRGAIAQDVVERHGLSLTIDARKALARTSADAPVRELVRKGIGVLSKTVFKRLGPLALVSTAASGVEVFALGLLFEHYVANVRPRGAVRVHAEEAREVRDRIDRAITRAFSPSVRPEPLPLLPGGEDLRDELTRWLDTAILAGASFPAYLERRLVAAFDELGRGEA